MNRTALLVALLVASAGGGLLYFYKQQFEENAVGGAPVAVIMAVKEIAPGTPITEDHIGVRYLPEAYLEARHIKVTDKENIVGVRTAYQIKPNETIQWTDLATGSSQATKLSSLVRVGMRAATVTVDGVTNSNLLVPGDRIDLSMTIIEPERGGPVSQPFMQNILVVAVGAHFGSDTSAADGRLLTVTVSPEAAQRLMLAPTQGRLTATLRNPDDVRILDNLGAASATDVLKIPKPAAVPIIAAPSEKMSPMVDKAIAQGFAAAQANESLLKRYLDGAGGRGDKSKNKR
ncbi:MAG: pilus assembly protein CpaB [Myxococcales bacterium]|jgi:pilus assembly protein CpaB|nr:pilus assembly protein CpaB [Myxococcales bacterium]